MRILHTIGSLRSKTGGPARSVPGLAAALGGVGAEVHLWSADVGDGPPQGAFALRTGPLDAVFDDGPWDLVHDHGLWLPLNHQVAMRAARRNLPRIVSPRGMLEPWALNHKKWKKRAAWWLYQRGDLHAAAALHATAESEAKQLRHLGLKSQIAVVPNGVEVPEEAGDGRQESGDRMPRTRVGDGESVSSMHHPSSSIHHPQSPRTALFLSRIQKKKGLPLLVEAWAKVRPAGWRMRVVGPDEDGHRAEVEALVRAAGLADRWEFSGPLDGAAKWNALREADLFILPTHSENFGIAVAEALAAGLPVITTTGAPWAGLEEHGAGWWVAPKVGELTEALQEACARDATNLQKMGGRGRRWMAADFSWEGVAKKMMACYEQILRERP